MVAINTHAYRNDNLTSSITRTGLADTDFTYTYDANKNKETEAISGTMANYGFSTGATGYDDEDRLTAWNRTDGNKDQAWTLTTEGNWQAFNETGTTPKTETRTHTAAHELTTVTDPTANHTKSLTYDVKGNITSHTNLNGDDYTYAWDFDNRLKQVLYGVDAAVEYTYDALGRRVSKALGTIASMNDPTVFVCTSQPLEHSPHAGQVIAEYQGSAAATSPDRKYVYATYIDEPVVMVDRTSRGSTAAGTDELFYYHRNNLYSVAAITNALAAVVERYVYDAYGNIAYLTAAGTLAATQASAVANPYTYTGRRLNDETRLYYYRARYYDSVLGRFIGRDPIGYKGSPWNMYEYVKGRSTARRDPSGLAMPRTGSGCCGGKRYVKYTHGCCNGQIYRLKSQCCENNQIVDKVTYWVCSRPISAWYGAILPNHKYICCDGPNKDCYGHQNNDLQEGDPIPEEGDPTGKCESREVCPATKQCKCDDPVSPQDADTFSWNCRDWAEWEPTCSECPKQLE